MSELKEQKFWRNELKIGFRALGHVNRVESPATSPGIPDVEVQLYGGPQWWIELKVADPHVKVRPAQKLWYRERTRVKGNCGFLIKVIEDKFNYYIFVVHNAPLDSKEPTEWSMCEEAYWRDHINWNEFEEVLRNVTNLPS